MSANENSDVTYVRYHATADESHLTAQLVECYRVVFADDPWHEWLKCANHVCGKYWGVKDAPLLAATGYMHCDKDLIDYWSRAEVLADIYSEIKRDRSYCWLVMDGDRVVGFCWGYQTDLPTFDHKMGIGVDFSLLGIDDPGTALLALQDEVGVLVPYRGRKFAKELVYRRNQDFRQIGLEYGLVRTRETPQPSVTYKWYKKVGYKILARYPEGDGRVIMGIKLSDLE